MRKILVAVLLSLTLVGCRMPSLFATSPGAYFGAASDAGGARVQEAPPLSGRVLIPRRVQATIKDDVAVAATVSLINTGSNRTEATGVTDDHGVFTLTLPKNYRPDPKSTYYLEAVKGLHENRPGHAVARVRTIVKFLNGWVSLTNTTPNQGINITSLTTAVAIGAGLRKGTASKVDFDALIGKIAGGVYTPVTNLSLAEVTALTSLVTSKLADDRDPVGAITLDTGTNGFELASPESPQVSTASVAVAQVGGTLTLTGSGFSTTPANNVVTINGTPVTVLSATMTSLTIQIPEGATSGQITVQVGGLIILGPVLSVAVEVETFSAPSGASGTTLTLTGSGFDPSDLANNVVVFSGGATASVTAATATSLTVTVPSGAVSGPVSINVLGSQTTSEITFIVPVVISDFSPAGGVAGTSVTLSGTGFSTTLASNSVKVNGVAATLTQASATSLRFTVPLGATTGPIAVTVAGQTASTAAFTVAMPSLAGASTIQTIAGWPLPPANRQASNWGFKAPAAMVRDGAGNTYVAGSGRIFKIDAAGVITHVAGMGATNAHDGDGGPATGAKFSDKVYALAVDASGNLYFADSAYNCVRMVDTSGVISTVVGVSSTSYSAPDGDGGLAVAARLDQPQGLAVDAAGNLYISEFTGHVIRKVAASSKMISTIAGNRTVFGYSDGAGVAKDARFSSTRGLLLDGDNLYVADSYRVWRIGLSGNTIENLAGAGAGDESAYVDGPGASARFKDCVSLAKDAAGNLYVGDQGDHRVRKIDASRNVTTVAGTGVAGYGGDGGVATSAQLNVPYGVVVDGAGRLYVADSLNHRIRRIEGGTISTVWGTGLVSYSGDNGLAEAAQVDPGVNGGVAVDSAGNLYLADQNNYRIRKIDRVTGVISTYAGTGAVSSSGDGGQATAASLQPSGLVFDASDNLYVGDVKGASIRKIARATGLISTYAPGMAYPRGLAFDAAGNLYVARGSALPGSSGTVVKIDPLGTVTTIAGGGVSLAEGVSATSARINGPMGLVLDASGSVYVADYGSHKVRKVSEGVITTVAGAGAGGDGGPALTAKLTNPYGLAMDASGTLYISEYGAHRIRKVDLAGDISLVAGTTQGFSGDNGQAASAQLSNPTSLTLADFGGTLYVNDSTNLRVRRLR
ncbi:IPT/TIG domain-containing protein [bacterium]|nr:IPT/TIG domain-containing protein [bacterium]